jgi:hypothetical protein
MLINGDNAWRLLIAAQLLTLHVHGASAYGPNPSIIEFTIPSLDDIMDPSPATPPPPPPRPFENRPAWSQEDEEDQDEADKDDEADEDSSLSPSENAAAPQSPPPPPPHLPRPPMQLPAWLQRQQQKLRQDQDEDGKYDKADVQDSSLSPSENAVDPPSPPPPPPLAPRPLLPPLPPMQLPAWLQRNQQNPREDQDEDEKYDQDDDAIVEDYAREIKKKEAKQTNTESTATDSAPPIENSQESKKKEVNQMNTEWMTDSINRRKALTDSISRRKASLLSFPRRQGQLDLEVQGLRLTSPFHSTRRIQDEARASVKSPAIGPDTLIVSVDPSAALRLIWIGSQFMGSLGLAMLGTLRLLAPLIVARRGLNWIGDIFMDWYTGRYLRKTYKRMEHNYWRFYQIPAVLRSAGRLSAQLTLLMTLGRIMESWVGLSHAPCLGGSGGCHWWCGILWIVAVVGTGHAGAAAIGIWGGPLRIQLPSDSTPQKGPSTRRVLTRPWHILQWLRDPDQWISEIASSRRGSAVQLKPFHPDPLIFPVTYEPLRIVLMVTIAKEMALNKSMMHSIMRQVLIQQAIGDEWFRVLLLERRVTLGIVVMVGYVWSTFSLFWTAARASYLSALLLLPSVLA